MHPRDSRKKHLVVVPAKIEKTVRHVVVAVQFRPRSELDGYDDMPHGFFNLGRYDNKMFLATVTRMHEFLKSLGYMKGKPTVDRFLKRLAKGK